MANKVRIEVLDFNAVSRQYHVRVIEVDGELLGIPAKATVQTRRNIFTRLVRENPWIKRVFT